MRHERHDHLTAATWWERNSNLLGRVVEFDDEKFVIEFR